jgi:membrane protein YqaA with SNARE-associated domain
MRNENVRRIVYVACVLGMVGIAIWLATLDLEGPIVDLVGRFGYLGYFLSACIAGINIFVPTSHLIFTAPLLNAGLDPWILAGCGALGASLADLVGYAVGDRGRATFTGATDRMARWLGDRVTRHPRLAPLILFVWAATIPLPNEILVIPAGVMGYGLARTFFFTFLGNICFNILAIRFGMTFL